MKEQVKIDFIQKSEILSIIPLLTIISQNDTKEVLEERVLEMCEQNYKCLGIYKSHELIGICGLWFMTRHYGGRSIELDHVVLKPDFQAL